MTNPDDPRDAEIAALKAEVGQLRRWGKERNDELCAIIDTERADLAAHKRALAAGPAALRGCKLIATREHAATLVEDAQAKAMREEP